MLSIASSGLGVEEEVTVSVTELPGVAVAEAVAEAVAVGMAGVTAAGAITGAGVAAKGEAVAAKSGDGVGEGVCPNALKASRLVRRLRKVVFIMIL